MEWLADDDDGVDDDDAVAASLTAPIRAELRDLARDVRTRRSIGVFSCGSTRRC